jgi:hypothetical protein
MSDTFTMTPGEQKAFDAILEASSAIRNIEEDDKEPLSARRRLTCNEGEFVSAIHVLQSFVKQHILHRMNPQQWNDWWESDDSLNEQWLSQIQAETKVTGSIIETTWSIGDGTSGDE